MKKRGLLAVFLALLLVFISPNVLSLESCSSEGARTCSQNQICEGETFSSDVLSSCCIGQCVDVKEISCEGLPATDINSRIKCEAKTLEQRFRDFSIGYPSFFVNWMIKFPPQKPYPKLWNFWLNVSLTLGALFIVLTAVGHLSSYLYGEASPAVLDYFKKHYVLTIFAGLILLSLPQILTLTYHLIDSLFMLIVKFIVPNGDLLSVTTWLTATSQSNILYLARDILYFLFLLVLILRYALLYLLLIFMPLIVVLYVFYYTEYAGEHLLRKIITNLTVPILWILIFTIAFVLFQQFNQPFFVPLFLAAVFYFNILVYRWYTGIDFSFRAIFRNVKRFAVRFLA